MQNSDYPNTPHGVYRAYEPYSLVYSYDPTDDGPEVEIIKTILFYHTFKELRNERILTLLGVGL